jgi:hypothetical protein
VQRDNPPPFRIAERSHLCRGKVTDLKGPKIVRLTELGKPNTNQGPKINLEGAEQSVLTRSG